MKHSPTWLLDRFRTSIWPIPILVCLAMFGLALIMIQIERHWGGPFSGYDSLVMTVPAARQLLGVIAGAVLSVGGVAFSITMVALSLTSGQYGPKILRHFLEDTGSKLSLGLYLGTCVYALVTIFSYAEGDRPGITAITALSLTVLALAAFIQFIHRTATDLQADQIIERIGGEMRRSLEDFGSEESLAQRSRGTLVWRRMARGNPGYTITAQTTGYLQSVDYKGLAAWCEQYDCVAQVRVRPGDFLFQNSGTCRLFGCDSQLLAARMDELTSFFLTGPLRTPVQDVEYPITQLNQLAARALSPGINDPGTAITCIDWFSMALTHIIDRDLPGNVFHGQSGRVRLLLRSNTFAGILKAVYAPLRQFSQASIPVSIALLESLVRLAEMTNRVERLQLLRRHGQLILEQIEASSLADYDIRDVRQRHSKLLRVTA